LAPDWVPRIRENVWMNKNWCSNWKALLLRCLETYVAIHCNPNIPLTPWIERSLSIDWAKFMFGDSLEDKRGTWHRCGFLLGGNPILDF
jgi:hypothetical protein